MEKYKFGNLPTFEEFLIEAGEGKYALFANKSGDTFWGDFGAGILPISKTTGKILVAYRSAYVNEPHTWGVWGGKLDVEDDNKLIDAAKREFKEESGYKGSVDLYPAFIFKSPNGSFEYYNFIGIVGKEFIPNLDWETETFKWVTYDELINLNNKHFGLEALLKDKKSHDIIKKYS